ncbi:hypothetical protein AB0J38_41695 [Streptomyces sp. NPDC050095]|uniref:hypothetical protein n=1 Tax=unclassified Streptomyces TaxID=2593676 RepID=UPI0034253C03
MSSATAVLSTPGESAARTADAEGRLPQWRRVLTVLAIVSLFIGTRTTWRLAVAAEPLLGAAITVAYAGILLCAVLALTVRGGRALGRVDLLVLALAVGLTLAAAFVSHPPNDEAALTGQAAHELAHGRPVYGQSWPWLFEQPGVAYTQTETGGYATTYGYPPLQVLLAAPLTGLLHGHLPATAVSVLALVVGTCVLWRMVPAAWRSAVVVACLGFGLLPYYARIGYPAVLACALMMPVVAGWPRLMRGGRLTRSDAARAACLGAACAAQQLPWFVAPFLLAGLYLVRRGEEGRRVAAVALARFTGVAIGVWLLINTYFVVQDPGAWLRGTALPLTQGGVLHGQGLSLVTLYLTDGSGRLAFYSYASMLLAAGLLVLFCLFVRRLGPVATVLPWCAFYVATRSQDGYYLLMTPLWVAAAVTVSHQDFARAWRPLRLRTRRVQLAVVAGVLAPAMACVLLAVSWPVPFELRQATAHAAGRGAVTEVSVDVTNRSGRTLTPHFGMSTGQGMSRWWVAAEGPRTLRPGARAHYVLRPEKGTYPRPHKGKRMQLRVFTADPSTLTNATVGLR